MSVKQIFLVNERYCPYCKRDVVQFHINHNELNELQREITGCPFADCKRSFVD